jgi:hypothetical protein
MQSLLLRRQDWKNILDQLSRAQDTHKVTIEIIREDFGAQKEVENVAFRGLSYDPKGGTIAIRAGAVEHPAGARSRTQAPMSFVWGSLEPTAHGI